MNLQKPIVKPSGAQSLFALRKTVGNGPRAPSAPSTAQPVTTLSKSDPVAKKPENHQELSLMTNPSVLMALQKKQATIKGAWHAPWKLHRVIQGHQGWVKTLDIDPSNEWFATGSNDRMIKIWDLATGVLRLSLTGHTHNVRALRIHPKYKYLFSAGEDNMVKCWDLEQNKVIRHYHGHLSGVYCMDVHPVDGFLFTGARDASIRMWDIRTKECVHVFGGHTHTVQCVKSAASPELISGSADATVRLWDIRTGRTRATKTLTHHKKGVRAISCIDDSHFSTAGADDVKIWSSTGELESHLLSDNKVDKIVNCTDFEDSERIFATGSDDGTITLYDWESKRPFQEIRTPPQPGSLEAENGIFALKFDLSGTRLITAECDKTIKMYRRDESAIDPTTHD